MLTTLFALSLLSNPAGSGLAAPFRVRDAQGFIDVGIGHAAPLVTDFDGDGVPDLLVGQFEAGKLRIYKNTGTAKAPKLESFTWFRTGEEEGKIPSG
jgi:hypothetical protein